ncbi:MAG TPA: DUF1801 domain-containing protein [Egibacteraceae bacterium]|nr:DUF1801 domain-containing protein [Egibacteraceae bacterium]
MFDEYLSELSDEDRQALAAVVEHVATVAPEAAEGRSYGLPAFRYNGKPLLGFAAHKGFLSLYPFSPAVLDAAKTDLAGFGLSKGAVRFTPQQPIPAEVLTQLVNARKREIDGA